MYKKKKLIVVTGGAGFVGSNLIKYLLRKTNFDIISIDNYSTGKKINHIKNKRVKYIKDKTKNIESILKEKKNIPALDFGLHDFSKLSGLASKASVNSMYSSTYFVVSKKIITELMK